ncbi:amidohydrolase family protein [Rhizobium cremeum]|uniref:amidohydrolase family protein n=1 Tax=Rhizobium cremeum TaxID=2813827 RepID=UPI001FD00DFA|nr:amidohydrolase family protein [Rhizobium cremeum]MCJ7997858.1 amidohydrolase family protein [Rhizobium cremeum]MCJ8002951.1 amidohydrolase family protein [Rhizobium cremeum]
MSSSGEICATHTIGELQGPGRNRLIRWQNGVITVVEDAGVPPPGAGRTLVMPALANAHDHVRPLPMSSFGTAFLPLEAWLPRTILATPPDAYMAAVAPLARSALSGCGAVMVHYTRPSGKLDPVDEACEVARAARDVGVRIAFAPAIRDRNPLVYGDETKVLGRLPPEVAALLRETYCCPPPSSGTLIEVTERIAEKIQGPMVDVQFGPAGVQWCSDELLRAVASRSAETGRGVHMHLLETPYQRRWADITFPQGIVTYLREIGLLSPRLTLAHCVHARPHELDMIADAGCRIVTNSGSNLHLRSGLGPIADARRRGCGVAIGVDGQALDEDDDIIREIRLANILHAGRGFAPSWSREEFLLQSTAHGRRGIGAPGSGTIAVGEPADFLEIDYDLLDRDRIIEVEPVDLFFARAATRHVRKVVVAGRTIVENGTLPHVDLAALEAGLRRSYRDSVRKFDALVETWPVIEDALGQWHRSFDGCC